MTSEELSAIRKRLEDVMPLDTACITQQTADIAALLVEVERLNHEVEIFNRREGWRRDEAIRRRVSEHD